MKDDNEAFAMVAIPIVIAVITYQRWEKITYGINRYVTNEVMPTINAIIYYGGLFILTSVGFIAFGALIYFSIAKIIECSREHAREKNSDRAFLYKLVEETEQHRKDIARLNLLESKTAARLNDLIANFDSLKVEFAGIAMKHRPSVQQISGSQITEAPAVLEIETSLTSTIDAS